MSSPNRALAWRKFVTLQVALGFVMLTVTGLSMFFWPPRQVAMATHYTLLGLGKGAWEDIHLTFSFLFIAAVAIHLWLNRRPLLAYLGNRARSFRFNLEALATLLLGAALTGGTLLLG